MNAPAHTIYLRSIPGGFAVNVEPVVPGFDFDLARDDRHYAFSYARSLSRQRKWPQTGEASA